MQTLGLFIYQQNYIMYYLFYLRNNTFYKILTSFMPGIWKGCEYISVSKI